MKKSDEYKGFDKGGEKGDEIFISKIFISSEILPREQEDIDLMLKWIENAIVKSFLQEVEKEFIGFNCKCEGISPMEQNRETIRKISPVTSCICCKHWRVNHDRTYLIGICAQSHKDTGYDTTCNLWKGIDKKKGKTQIIQDDTIG